MSAVASRDHGVLQQRGALAALLSLVSLLSAGCPGPAALEPKHTSTTPKQQAHSSLHGLWHRVTPGESTRSIAQHYGVPRADIEEINGIERWEVLKPGRQLFVPGAGAQGSGQGGAASQPALKQREPKPANRGRFIWPVRGGGQLTSGFGQRRGKRTHEGIDIAADAGTAVLAVADGVVMYAGSGVRGYGNLILVKHDDGYVSVYAHNRANLVAEGDRVTRGQSIAEVGRTGKATGDHLHFELRFGDRPLDPLSHLKRP